jgi:hypothetical protein
MKIENYDQKSAIVVTSSAGGQKISTRPKILTLGPKYLSGEKIKIEWKVYSYEE